MGTALLSADVDLWAFPDGAMATSKIIDVGDLPDGVVPPSIIDVGDLPDGIAVAT